MSYPSKSYFLRHKIISFARDLEVKGIRRLSVMLPNMLLPEPKKAGKHILKTIHGVKLLIDPSVDKGVELSLYQTGTYEKGTIQLLEQFLKPEATFLDIGANIGLMSAIAAKSVGENGRVWAVEANPKTIDILNYNLNLNQLKNVSVLPIGVSDRTGTAKIYENGSVNRGGALLIQQGASEGVEIRIERLDDLFEADTRLDVVKIDVEGMEPAVISGGKNWFTQQQPILIVEVSDVRENQSGATPQETMTSIRELGDYRFFKQKGTKERRGKLLSVLSEHDLPKHDNLICIPASKTV